MNVAEDLSSIESSEVENAHFDVTDKDEMIASCRIKDDLDDGVYGELILLGYNGCQDNKANIPLKRHRTKMTLYQRKVGNGIKKGSISQVNVAAKLAPAVQDSTRHVVSYSYGRNQTVLVEYLSDPSKDMFQIGRSSEEQIDFTIVDTWLASGNDDGSSPRQSNHSSASASRGVRSDIHRLISSTISRYACRILIDRENSSKAFLYAAGFDNVRNIFLGEKATKWTKKNTEVDGLTTNGILILHPNRNTEEKEEPGVPAMYVWREVSVDGDIYTLRETRSSNSRGELVPDETNMLQDGTLIDLCGATLLWRTASGLAKSPTAMELESALDRLNAGKPQCPVSFQTLIIPKRKQVKGDNCSKQPYVYLRCGHVQGKHQWGQHALSTGQQMFKCPICLLESERIIQLTMGMESSFHLDSGVLDHAFNPCGHVASKDTVMYWSRIPLPHGTNSFYPVCPFCTSLLADHKPFVRLIFQDHLFD